MHVAKAIAWYFAASMVLWLLDIAIGRDLERYVAAQGVAHGWPKAASGAYAVIVGALSVSIRFGPAYLLWRGWTLERMAVGAFDIAEALAAELSKLSLKNTWQFWLLVAWLTYALNHSNSNPAAPPPPPEPAPAAQAQPIDPMQLEKARREFGLPANSSQAVQREPTPEEMERARRLFDGK